MSFVSLGRDGAAGMWTHICCLKRGSEKDDRSLSSSLRGAKATKQSSLLFGGKLDCFASLAMATGENSRYSLTVVPGKRAKHAPSKNRQPVAYDDAAGFLP